MKYIILYQVAFSDIVMIGANSKTFSFFFSKEEAQEKLEDLISRKVAIYLTKEVKEPRERANYWIVDKSSGEWEVIGHLKYKALLSCLKSNCVFLEEVPFYYASDGRVQF